jgi:hypothetical protein
MLNRTFKKLALAGLATALIAPAGAAARPALDGQSVAAGGGPGVSAQDFRAPDQVTGGSTSTQDMRATDQVSGATTPATAATGTPTWPVDPQPIAQPQAASSSTTSDDGIDVGWIIGLGGAALVSLAGLAVVLLVRGRQHAAA